MAQWAKDSDDVKKNRKRDENEKDDGDAEDAGKMREEQWRCGSDVAERSAKRGARTDINI